MGALEKNFLREKIILTVFMVCSHILCAVSVAENKLCTDKVYDECQQLGRGQEIECFHVRSKADCLIKADQGLPHLALLTAEEAMLGAPLVSDNVVVIGEVIPRYPPYQIAVLVRSSFAGGFDNLRGLRYCHPGFNHDGLISRYVLEELESKILKINCSSSDNTTLLEKRIGAVAEFFSNSCRPGKWTDDRQLDAILKSRYPSLCSNCNSNEKCGIDYKVPLNDSIYSCLLGSGGDIAVTSLRDALYFFNTSSSASNFQYLCADGTVSNSSCTWTDQLFRLLITSSNSADGMKTILRTHLESRLYITSGLSVQSSQSSNFETILGLERRDSINLTDPIPLKTYVQARRKIPTVEDSKLCNISVKWSTKNDREQQKCLWLQQASLNAGLQPVIECVKNTDEDVLSSLDDIKNGFADVSFTDANYGYIALKKGLTNIAYPETDNRELSHIMIVVREDTQNISSLNDLSGLRSCFPEYGGKEWLAFVDTLREQNILGNSCDYGKIFSEFVGNSCVPGVKSNDYGIPNADQDKLCENCVPVSNTLTAKYCNADDGNKYFGSLGVLNCLTDGSGDFGVISKNDIIWASVNTSAFRVVSRNGSLAKYTGFDVDLPAYLTIITAGEVVIKMGSSITNDSVVLLEGIEVEFGQSSRKPFKVFDEFNGTKDLLFPDSTPGLSFGDTKIQYVENFQKLLRTSEQCVTQTSGVIRIYPIVLTVFIAGFGLLL